ncbi:GIY-YIG nuclease family protein [Candidatus Falkowbacteria bacterium]|nr:GIY-YIG nuclease family protein [Candidatus Falkowbacteria bacterium]
MTKEEIILEIKRTADENGGKPLGIRKFCKLTGIPNSAWLGKYWRSWNSAIKEAGLEKNEMKKAYSNEFMIHSIILLTRKNKQFPAQSDMKIEKRINESFPSYEAIFRLGNASKRLELVRNYATDNSEYSDILQFLPDTKPTTYDDNSEISDLEKTDGFVYMVKEQYSKQYKIGKTFDVPRRHREIALELPGDLKKVHAIRTDDPSGIEAYWHKRFENKHTNGEWFTLTPDDIRAFKRRKFM